VTAEASISISPSAGDLYYTDAPFREASFTTGDKSGRLRAAFPKGYAGFYQMKYEVTEQQYVDFLNGVAPEQARRRWAARSGGHPVSAFRHTIQRSDGRYQTRQPHRAASYLAWRDALAWADWMGLRPMTGLEFEKSARGPKPARFRELAWGGSEADAAGRFALDRRVLNPEGALAASEGGGEVTDGNVHLHMRPSKGFPALGGPCMRAGYYNPTDPSCRALQGGDGGWGALRVGIHGVDAGGNRAEAGAGYYGAMDLSGNLTEQVVTIGHPQGRAFRGTHGDGRLSPQGAATNSDWHPQADTSYFAHRGGSWVRHPNHGRVADRGFGLVPDGTQRLPTRGFRAVRSLR
jgi:hypothetical protein